MTSRPLRRNRGRKAVITPELERRVRYWLKNDVSVPVIARRFDLPESAVYKIKEGLQA